MKTHILKGSKQEIAEGLARISGEVREAIVFEDKDAASAHDARLIDVENVFAEMRPYMVDAQDVDDSRQAIYSRMAGE